MIYLLDANTIGDLLRLHPEVTRNFETTLSEGNKIAICQPIHYEVLRGLIRRDAKKQIQNFNQMTAQLAWYELRDEDWILAAQFWAEMRGRGKQLSDVDLLLAALANRLDAIIASSDDDFDPLSIKRENWREL